MSLSICFDNIMMKFMINNRTDAWKTDVNLLNGKLRGRARWTKSCTVTDYPNEQNDAILPARDNPLSRKKIMYFFSYNRSFIDQACLVKMVGYWPRFFFFFCANLRTSTPSCNRSVNTQKRNLANIQPSWPQADFIIHPSNHISLIQSESVYSISLSWMSFSLGALFGTVRLLESRRL